MKLRTWQSECIKQAISQYKSGQSHFLCLATPGAGKTLMASKLAKKLLDEKLIDLVICIGPALIISEDFRNELESQLGKKLDGKLGSIGRALTYHAMLNEEHIWELFDRYKVFVIFDEIHHCAGHELENSNAWGQKIISNIQGRATYTLALTGTPWRSDSIPIALSRYSEDGLVHCDYSYGLTRAIKDKVCRKPSITLFDNNKITLNESGSLTEFNSFDHLLQTSNCNYQSLIENEVLIQYMLEQASNKLNSLRRDDPTAGGLIVATSVSHAKDIHRILKQTVNEDAQIVTYLESDAVALIRKFKHSKNKWIISVGMISEGTNIPRLKICCYLTRVKTELYFRQVMGRVLRANGADNDIGYFYMPAEPTLSEFAYRVNEDIPDESIVKMDLCPIGYIDKSKTKSNGHSETLKDGISLELSSVDSLIDVIPRTFPSKLEENYGRSLEFLGRFNKTVFDFNLQI